MEAASHFVIPNIGFLHRMPRAEYALPTGILCTKPSRTKYRRPYVTMHF